MVDTAKLKGSNNVKRVGIWLRVSTEEQAESDSPEHHEKRARYYAEAKGWQVIEVYHLEAVSGKSVLGHPETVRMLKDVGSGRISGLIFSKLARLARNTKELLDIADSFKESGADLISLGESIDTSSPAGRMFFTVQAALTQFEREEIAERVAASVPVRARLGKPLGGAAPYGYQWKEGKLAIHPEESPVRKLLYELFIEHRRKKTVARLLNEAGHRTRSGACFSDTTVRRLLRDPIAKGVRRANYTKSLGEKKHWVLKPEDQWVFTEAEAIVTEEVWEQCNHLMEAQKQRPRFSSRKPVHLFAGVVFCYCGEKMYVPSNTPKYVCFKCRNKLPVIDLESIYQEQLRDFFLSPSDVMQYAEKADSALQDKQELLVSLAAKERKLKTDMDKLTRLYLDEKISAEGFDVQYKTLEEQAEQTQNRIPEIETEVKFIKSQLLSSDQILKSAGSLYSNWSSLKQDEKRQIVDNTVEKIVVGQGDVTLEIDYLLSPSKGMATSQCDVTDSSPPRA